MTRVASDEREPSDDREPWQSGTYADAGDINFPPGQDKVASDDQGARDV